MNRLVLEADGAMLVADLEDDDFLHTVVPEGETIGQFRIVVGGRPEHSLGEIHLDRDQARQLRDWLNAALA
jgi:hypothetical protein